MRPINCSIVPTQAGCRAAMQYNYSCNTIVAVMNEACSKLMKIHTGHYFCGDRSQGRGFRNADRHSDIRLEKSDR